MTMAPRPLSNLQGRRLREEWKKSEMMFMAGRSTSTRPRTTASYSSNASASTLSHHPSTLLPVLFVPSNNDLAHEAVIHHIFLRPDWISPTCTIPSELSFFGHTPPTHLHAKAPQAYNTLACMHSGADGTVKYSYRLISNCTIPYLFGTKARPCRRNH